MKPNEATLSHETDDHDADDDCPAHTTRNPDDQFSRCLSRIRNRLTGGLLLLLPLLVTMWILFWGYSILQRYLIEPFAAIVIFKAKWKLNAYELPDYFTYYIAPVIAILLILMILYVADLLANTRLRGWLEWLMANMPIVSFIYSPVRKLFGRVDQSA